jgi:hypothetical protein
LHHLSGDATYRDKAELTLETFAGVAEQYGIFAATYGIAVAQFLESALQVVVVSESETDEAGASLAGAANAVFSFNKSVIRIPANQAVEANLPPALAATIPHLPELKSGKPFAVLCSGFTCQPAIHDPAELRRAVKSALEPSR